MSDSKADRVVVVSPQKAGTHLIQELFITLGYASVGAIKQNDRNTPEFTHRQRLDIARVVFGAEDFEACAALPPEEFRARTDLAWKGMLYAWYRRFGQPVTSRYGAELARDPDVIITNPDFYSQDFESPPAGVCWFWHDFSITRVDGLFVSSWTHSRRPPLILNYRDPRDALISVINFMEGKTAQGFGNFFERLAYNRILLAKDSMAAKIEYALTDPSFPGGSEYEDNIWLLHHPDVLKSRFEDLVGAEGNGSEAAQVDSVARILEHVGSDADPKEVAARLYNTNSWSFFRGKTGDWRNVFTPRLRDMFAERYGTTLDHYGYER